MLGGHLKKSGVIALTPLAFLLAAVPSQAQTLRERLQGSLVGAHMGGLFHSSPNSIKQFEKARKWGANILEMDLRVSSDGVAMVFHNAKLSPATFCRGLLKEQTAERIRRCRYTLGWKHVATFEEVLAWAKGRIVINAEFKDIDVIEPAIDMVRKYDAYEWVYFQTKCDPERYRRARHYDPNVALLFRAHTEEQIAWAIGLNDDNLMILEIGREMATPENISAIHESGKLASINSWVYGPPHELFRAGCKPVFRKNIDIAISNRPGSCVKQRDLVAHDLPSEPDLALSRKVVPRDLAAKGPP